MLPISYQHGIATPNVNMGILLAVNLIHRYVNKCSSPYELGPVVRGTKYVSRVKCHPLKGIYCTSRVNPITLQASRRAPCMLFGYQDTIHQFSLI